MNVAYVLCDGEIRFIQVLADSLIVFVASFGFLLLPLATLQATNLFERR